MNDLVARSLHFVACCTPYTVATCNKREFPGGLTYETRCCTPATNALRNEPSRCRPNQFRCSPLQHLLQHRISCHFVMPRPSHAHRARGNVAHGLETVDTKNVT
jgi:hypothetical protein